MADVKKIWTDLKDVATGTDEHKDGMSKKRAAFSGAIVGMVVGMIMGYACNWNLFYSIAGGGVIGGVGEAIAAPKD